MVIHPPGCACGGRDEVRTTCPSGGRKFCLGSYQRHPAAMGTPDGVSKHQSPTRTTRRPGRPATGGVPTSSTFFRVKRTSISDRCSPGRRTSIISAWVFSNALRYLHETSGGLRDIISSPYLTSVGSGVGNRTGSAGTVEFLQERDYFLDMRGKLFNRLEYVVGIMNNNNYEANATGSNAPKASTHAYDCSGATCPSSVSRRFKASRTTPIPISTVAAREPSIATAGFSLYLENSARLHGPGEIWQGHDGANQTTVGRPANGACDVQLICGGSGALGQRRTWYVAQISHYRRAVRKLRAGHHVRTIRSEYEARE